MARRGRSVRPTRSVRRTGVLLAVLMMVGIPAMPAAGADRRPVPDCAGDLGAPVPGSVAWDEADLDNQRCAAEGLRNIEDNPAVAAATAANAAAHGRGHRT